MIPKLVKRSSPTLANGFCANGWTAFSLIAHVIYFSTGFRGQLFVCMALIYVKFEIAVYEMRRDAPGLSMFPFFLAVELESTQQ